MSFWKRVSIKKNLCWNILFSMHFINLVTESRLTVSVLRFWAMFLKQWSFAAVSVHSIRWKVNATFNPKKCFCWVRIEMMTIPLEISRSHFQKLHFTVRTYVSHFISNFIVDYVQLDLPFWEETEHIKEFKYLD